MNRYMALRYEKGVTQGDVAQATGLSRQTIMRLESGGTPRPAAPTAKALAKFYGMTVAALLGMEPEAPATPDPEPVEEEAA